MRACEPFYVVMFSHVNVLYIPVPGTTCAVCCGIFILYQLIDGFKFSYKVVREGATTDDIPLDFLFFCLGELSTRYIVKFLDSNKLDKQ